MLRVVLGVIVGLISWLIMWFASEKILSAIWPAFGAHQRAFEDVLKNGGQFTAETSALLTHVVLGSIVSVIAGCVAALIAGENARAPLFVGILLLAMGVMKAVMSWQYVPVWYHILFTAILLPMAVIGGRLITTT